MNTSLPFGARIGRLQDIDLRGVWASEPADFTPWLAGPENLQFLADSLELPGLELVRTEHPVDGFSADVVCRIVGTEHHVLIENQLERTDHRHLGQVLTYAPRFDARIVVWIAREFTDAHRAALDWLNRITGEDYAFFGAEVRAVRIGDSIPAPLFDVVVRPNEWIKVAPQSVSAAAVESEYNASTLRFWAAFHDRLREAGGPLRKIDRPLKHSNYWAPLTSDGRCYLNAWRSQGRTPGVGAFLGFYNAGAEQAFAEMAACRDELEAAFGEKLEWSINKGRTVFKIVAASLGAPTDEADWSRQHAWLVERMIRMRDTFAAPALAALGAASGAEP